MTHWIKPKIPRKYIILALLIALLGLGLAARTLTDVKYKHFSHQVAAATLMQNAIDVIKQAKLDQGLTISQELDPNQTGLIGAEFTHITTSLGNLEAKRTSTSPTFAAAMVRLFYEAGLKNGDVVAIGASGSFPGLIIATLAACQAMQLEAILFYSVGASMYGANIPEFTLVDMLQALRENQLLCYDIQAISLGGNNDQGEGGFFPDTQDTMMKIAKSAGAPLIYEENLQENIQKRLTLYLENNNNLPPACFVNIGGASPNHGNTNASLKFPSGLVTNLSFQTSDPERGLIFEYLEQGVPVIHLLNIRGLATKMGIAIDPIPFPAIGSEAVYHDVQYNKWLIWTTLGGIFMVFVFTKKKKPPEA